jgi:hypothetical protein
LRVGGPQTPRLPAIGIGGSNRLMLVTIDFFTAFDCAAACDSAH